MTILRTLTIFSCTVFTVVFIPVKAIVGGRIVENIQRASYMVSLQHNGDHHCGGILIGYRHALTAAHCLINDDSSFKPIRLKAVMGRVDLKTSDGTSKMVVSVYVPLEYKPQDIKDQSPYVADIAVVKFDSAIDAEKYELDIVRIARSAVISDYDLIANFFGYGYNVATMKTRGLGPAYIDGTSDDKLRIALVDMVANYVCRNYYADGYVAESHICGSMVQEENTKYGLCNGDSGGGLVLHEEIIGIFSESIGCDESENPALYTRVEHYSKFIDQSVSGNTTLARTGVWSKKHGRVYYYTTSNYDGSKMKKEYTNP